MTNNSSHNTSELCKNWRADLPTSNQLRAIRNMGRALKFIEVIPKTKGEAYDLITHYADIMKRTSYTSYDYPDSREDWNEAQGGW